MAGRARLSPAGAGARLLALLVLVLLLHALTLQWFARELEQKPVLRPLATPMFTRVLVPEAPVAVPGPAPAPSPAAPPGPARRPITTVARPVMPEAKPASPPASAAQALAKPPPEPEAPLQATPSTPEPTPTLAAAPDPLPAASAATTVAAADSWPADTRLNYRLSGHFRGELHGKARVQWQREGERYQTRVEIDLYITGVVLTSQGDVTPRGLVPRAYEELRRGAPRGVRLGNENIMLNSGISVPRPVGVQDTASQFVELSHRFATGKDVLEVGRSVSFWMARPNAVDLWTYDIVAKETLQTPELGPIEAFHLKPRPLANPRGNITAEMWFAPSLQYLPVRIMVKMGDEAHVDLIVLNIEQK